MALEDIRALISESQQEQGRFEPLPTKVAHRIDKLEQAVLALADEVQSLQEQVRASG